jgi:hypothetical protein
MLNKIIMNNQIKSFIKKIVPPSIKEKRYEYIYKKHMNKLKWRVIEYLENDPINTCDVEKMQAIYFIRKSKQFSVFPYDFIYKYHKKNIIVYTDDTCGLKYIMHDNNKRLYFKRGWDEEYIKNYYNGLLIEQDMDSPHRYENEDFHVYNGNIVVDIGVAEGNFAFSIIEKCEKLYLFEADNEWIEALNMTFYPWLNSGKVIIINKKVSDNNDSDSITLDNYFIENEKINFIKVDIEGYELKFLEGAKELLKSQKNIRVAICTYHRQDVGDKINNIMTTYGFHSEYSKGLMVYFTDESAQPCWLTRGLLRCIKSDV